MTFTDTLVFTVEVDFTDRTKADGRFVATTKVVEIMTNDPIDATLGAAQMVDCTVNEYPLHGLVIATRIVGVAV